MAFVEYIFQAGSWDYPSSNLAPLDQLPGNTCTWKVHVFDDATDESIENQFPLTSDLDTSGTITFEVYMCAVTSTTVAATVVFDLKHAARADDESYDYTLITESSGAAGISAGSSILNRITWTETVSNAGWAANDMMKIILARDADNGSDTLVDDAGVAEARIIVPVV